jgi:DUF4097 and DUF4098 domain-containing protein YvlB
MRRVLAAAAVALLVLASSAIAKEWTFAAKPGETLEIELESGGSIEVRGTASTSVTVEITVQGRDADELVVDAARTERGVRVTSGFKRRMRHSSANADISVTVPARFDVVVETMGGSVRIEDVEGTFRGESMGGGLTLLRLKGSADLTTMGGEIEVSDSTLDGRVETMGGDVTFRQVSGGLRGKTMGGQMRIEGADGGDGSGGAVKIQTMGGDIDVPSAPHGAEVETMGGDIRIDAAKGFVKATTMGGQIRIREMDGRVEATTMAGDVEIHVVGEGGSLEISSMSGDLELWLPADFSAAFDLELAYTRGHDGDHEIRSDFQLSESRSPDWEYGKGADRGADWGFGKGSPRKYIRATGKAGSGKYRVELTTINGNIVIHRGG